MNETDPLTAEQRQRLAVLYATQDALRIELNTFDLINCANWVLAGRYAPAVPEYSGDD